MTGYDPNYRPDRVPADPDRPPSARVAASGPPPDEAPTVRWTPPPASAHAEAPAPPPTAQRIPVERRSNRLRWGIALLVTALVVAVAAAAVLLLTRQQPPSNAAGYAPPGSVAYGEVRLDLPGDQRQQLGEFLSKFPGFADQSTLDMKIDDVLDRLVRGVSEDRQDWSTDIKPWFGGQLAFALGELPDPDAVGEDPQAEVPRGVLVLRITDAGRARAWFEEVTAELPTTETSHQGVPLVVFGEGRETGAMAIHNDRVMLVGDEASVRAAIDTGGNSNFGSEGRFPEALATLEGEGLGFVYFDARRYLTWIQDVGESMPGASVPPLPFPEDSVPEWVLVRVRAEGDALAFESVAPRTEATAGAGENRAGVVAGIVPASTIVLAEGHEVGDTILRMIELAKEDPEVAESIEQFEQQVALIGGLDGLIGWWRDAGFAVTREADDSLAAGLVIQPTDPGDAERLIGVIRAGVMLGGGGSGVTVREEEHAGATITVLDLGEIESIASLLMMGVALSPDAELPEGRVELAMAATEEVVVVGSGPAFVRSVLDAAGGDSLADDARYQALVGRVGAENLGSMFVDVTAIRELLETLAAKDPEKLAEYERDVKPYLEPFDAIVQASRRDGDHDRTVSFITVR